MTNDEERTVRMGVGRIGAYFIRTIFTDRDRICRISLIFFSTAAVVVNFISDAMMKKRSRKK